ncbi:MAG: hypothetical protein B7Z47_03625 [Chthoniobacter sp. 12-60-6]|nr:MAG: hypothetical protein B7Z47_03625 [Chthoniobacter sp. 12-60-6]
MRGWINCRCGRVSGGRDLGMNIVFRAFVICAGLVLVGCGERAAKVSEPKGYEKGELTFLYPGNWKIDEDEMMGGGGHHLSISTPGDALVVVQFFPLEIASSLEDYARAFSKETAAAVPVGKLTGSKFTPQADADGYTCLKETCTMELMGQAIAHVRYFRSRDFGGQRCFLLCQVAGEDVAEVEAGFKQVASSLKVTDDGAAGKKP